MVDILSEDLEEEERTDPITALLIQNQRERRKLVTAVRNTLIKIADISSILENPGDVCGDIRSIYIRQRMLHSCAPMMGKQVGPAMFGQCAIPFLAFDLQVHTVPQWIRLHATTIRCSVEKCGSGFVFLSWHRSSWGHSTVLFFDIQQKKQVLMEPSLALPRDILNYVRENHVWLPKSEQPHLSVIDDYNIPSLEPLQRQFRPPSPLGDEHTGTVLCTLSDDFPP